ncbi:hypothetical protein ACN28I_43355 [Archangium gephyra]|uniref:hypothetical protein n=1 Tax=Archangium gephyra TaxID=48 RepID=UPI003B7E6478
MRAHASIDTAWSLLREALSTPASPDTKARLEALDEQLAAFVRASPGALESVMLAGVDELASSWKRLLPWARLDGESSRLAVLLTRTPPGIETRDILLPSGPTLERTLQVMEPLAMLRVFAAARRKHPRILSEYCWRQAFDLAAFFVQRAEPDALDRVPRLLPDERDFLRSLATGEPLADILPDNVHDMTPEEIASALARYRSVTVEELEASLRPGRLSESGFLAPGERLGEVILRDARTLHRLGVRRHELARKLERIHQESLEGTLGPPWRYDSTAYLGHQEDPFHTLDVYEIRQQGAHDFELFHTGLGPETVLRSGDLLFTLIRRACFFEGAVQHRIDPEKAVRVLGLG